MCNFAKNVNLYFRDKITNADIVLTYLFIISMIIVLIFYTQQYYEIVMHDLDKCEKEESHSSCLKTEMTYIIVPYVGIVYSFFQVLYKVSDIIAFLFSCLLCCKEIDSNKDNEEINIELSEVYEPIIVV
jgi:hypothetical protein